MSDMMQMPPGGGGQVPTGGGMPAQGGGDTGEVLESMRSAFNPADAAAMNQKLGPDATIREAFAQMGVDVDGPISQLGQMFQEQIVNADPNAKMQALANTQPPADPIAGGAPGGGLPGGGQAPPQQGPMGLEALMQ